MAKRDVGFGRGSLHPKAGKDLFLSRNAPKTAEAFMARPSPGHIDEEWTIELILQTALMEIGPVAFVEAFLDDEDAWSAQAALERCLVLAHGDPAREALIGRLVDLLLAANEPREAEKYLDVVTDGRKERALQAVLDGLDRWTKLRYRVFGSEGLWPRKLDAAERRKILERAVHLLLHPSPERALDVEADIAYFIARTDTPDDLRGKLLKRIAEEDYTEAASELLAGKVWNMFPQFSSVYHLSQRERVELLHVAKKASLWERLGFIFEPHSRLPLFERLALLWG